MSFVFENVSKQFLNQNESTLQRINLEIQTGEFVCIVGKSGCGKSTLLNLAAGLLTPSSGRILLDGKEVNGPGVERTVMFQEHALYPWLTVRENVEFGMKLAGVSKEKRQEKSDYYFKGTRIIESMRFPVECASVWLWLAHLLLILRFF